jgi:hypothetical protein
MQEQAWGTLLRQVPAAFHDGMILATVTGVDVVMQGIIRLEENFLVLRGRPAGTSDNGRLMVLPYRQINYISFPGKPSDAQIQAIFGGGELTFAAQTDSSTETDTKSEMMEQAYEEQGHVNGAAQHSPHRSEPPASTPVQASKSVLLAKLRAKLTGDASKSSRK